MANGTFRLEHIKHVVDKIASKTHFPIADAAALEAAVGGAGTAVALGEEQHQASDVHQIPADFFPVNSPEDLFTKLAFLRSANGDVPSDLKTGGRRRTDAPPSHLGSPPQRAPRTGAGRNAPSATPHSG